MRIQRKSVFSNGCRRIFNHGPNRAKELHITAKQNIQDKSTCASASVGVTGSSHVQLKKNKMHKKNIATAISKFYLSASAISLCSCTTREESSSSTNWSVDASVISRMASTMPDKDRGKEFGGTLGGKLVS